MCVCVCVCACACVCVYVCVCVCVCVLETRRQTGSASGYTSHSAESRGSHQGSTSAESATKDHMVHNQHQELPATSSNLEQAPADKDAVRAE